MDVGELRERVHRLRLLIGLPQAAALDGLPGPQSPVPKYLGLKSLPAEPWPAVLSLASATRGWGYNIIGDDADETPLVVGPLTLRDSIFPNNGNETRKPTSAPHQRGRSILWEVDYGR